MWTAYEAAVRLTHPDHLKALLKEERFGERGRRLFEEHSGDFPQIVGVKSVAHLAELRCERGNLFDDRLSRIRARFSNREMIFSAELTREFRDFIVHGEDEVPHHEAWHFGRAAGEATARIRRFYAIGRLLLILIQALAAAAVSEHFHSIRWGAGDDFERPVRDPKAVLMGLHLLAA